MIEDIHWSGGIDGVLVLQCQPESLQIDRPGDLVSRLMEQECEPRLQTAALIYGYSLATQGVLLPHLIRQVLQKTGACLRSVSMDSMPLYRAIEHFDLFFKESALEGEELREAVLAEAARYHQELVSR